VTRSLHYYNTENDINPKHSIDLRHVLIEKLVNEEDKNHNGNNNNKSTNSYAFKLSGGPDVTDLSIFAASSKKECMEWIHAIQAIIDNRFELKPSRK